MKFILGVVFILILAGIISCSMPEDYLFIDLGEMTTEEAVLYTRLNIRYKAEAPREYWQYPEETYLLKTGDCEDQSAFLGHLFIYNVGLDDVRLIWCARKTDGAWHMVVRVADVYYEATYARVDKNFLDNFDIVREYTLAEYNNAARWYH